MAFSNITFLFLLPFLLFANTCTAAGRSRTKSPFSKIYAFGDSFTDTGNTKSSSRPFAFGYVSSAPYGATFFHHSTNRYSDGRLVVDFLATTLSMPFLPPYLNRSADFSNGANFAVAGSTALAYDFFQKNNISLDVTPQSLNTQLQWFDNFLEGNGCQVKGSANCQKAIEDALFWVGEIGVNDFAYSTGSSLKPETIRTLGINKVTTFLKALLDRGAKYMVVQGQPLIGCLPLTMTLVSSNDRDDLGCSSVANKYSNAYNNILQNKLQEFRKQYPRATISYADYSAAHRKIMKSPATFGFTESFKACCGSGGDPYNFDVFATCGSPLVSTACSNPAKFVNWDGVHLTEATYKVVSNMFFQGEYCKPPFPMLLKSKEHVG